jgi:8-oxo-dGTP pyrophosphatase MutT (NUDIX family)
MWKILVGFNKKHWSRQIPSGKIDLWESHELTIKREIEEETNLAAKKTTGIWNSKVILNGMVWQWYFYETEVAWILKANEIDTTEIYKRVSLIKTDTRLWFWITDGKETITDPLEILQYWHMFAEIFWTYKFPAYVWLMWGEILLPTDVDKDEQYIQYRDQEKSNLQIKKYKDFLSIIEI